MVSSPIVHSHIGVKLSSLPINKDWIRRGDPRACYAVLSRSKDSTATVVVWDCTPGTFEWRYDMDETIHILEGSIVLNDGHGTERRFGPGDVVFFPSGAVVHWVVETHVRKLAFLRRTVPLPFAFMTRATNWVLRLFNRRDGGDGIDGSRNPEPAAPASGHVI